MRTTALILALSVLGVPAQAQDGGVSPALGRRLTEQHCGVCHARILHVNNPTYGPVLHKELVPANEAAYAKLIAEGTPRMPGFKHMFDDREISSIIAYLKTIPKPADFSGPAASGERDD